MPKREKRATAPGKHRVTRRRLHRGDEKRWVLRVHYGCDGSTNAAQHKMHKMEKAYDESREKKIAGPLAQGVIDPVLFFVLVCYLLLCPQGAI